MVFITTPKVSKATMPASAMRGSAASGPIIRFTASAKSSPNAVTPVETAALRRPMTTSPSSTSMPKAKHAMLGQTKRRSPAEISIAYSCDPVAAVCSATLRAGASTAASTRSTDVPIISSTGFG